MGKWEMWSRDCFSIICIVIVSIGGFQGQILSLTLVDEVESQGNPTVLALGIQSDGSSIDRAIKPVLNMGFPVRVVLEDPSGIDLVPVDSVVGVQDFVGFDPLVSNGSFLNHNAIHFCLLPVEISIHLCPSRGPLAIQEKGWRRGWRYECVPLGIDI